MTDILNGGLINFKVVYDVCKDLAVNVPLLFVMLVAPFAIGFVKLIYKKIKKHF